MRSCSGDDQSSVNWHYIDQRSRSFSLPSAPDHSAPPPGYPSSSLGDSSTSSWTTSSYPQIPPPSRHQPSAAVATSQSKADGLDTRYYTLRPLEATTFELVNLEESWELIPSIPAQSMSVSDATQDRVGHQVLGNRRSPRPRCAKTSRRKKGPRKPRSATAAPQEASKRSTLARLLRPAQREEQSRSMVNQSP